MYTFTYQKHKNTLSLACDNKERPPVTSRYTVQSNVQCSGMLPDKLQYTSASFAYNTHAAKTKTWLFGLFCGHVRSLSA